MLIFESASKKNKQTPFSGLWNWMVEKLTNAVIDKLTTENKTVFGALNELNSKTEYQNSIGLINKGEFQYNSQDISDALKNAYSKLYGVSIFDGILYAKRDESNYGYIKMTSYIANMEEHKYVLMGGTWSWIS